MKYEIPRYRAKLVRDGKIRVPTEKANTADAAVEVIRALTRNACGERFIVLFLNGRNVIVGAEVAAIGGLHGCALTPSDVFRGAILACASAVILGHSHPSGDPTPSIDDVQMTSAVVRAGNVLHIRVLDHLVVTRDGPFASLRSQVCFDDE
jgi:DNA repair protein RadC